MPEPISPPIAAGVAPALSMRDCLLKLSRREDLTQAEARQAFSFVMSGQASEAQMGGLLIGLASKGTTADELIGAAMVMREKAVAVGCSPEEGVILDTCGTGGDVKGTFNISTASALTAAACGVRVVKHGNRSASSKSGSADVLEKLGVKLEVMSGTLERCVKEANICFAFARSHHPAMKHVAPVRTSLGIPTIFNLLGPLTNPAQAEFQLIGVPKLDLAEKLARALSELGTKHALVVCGNDELDEVSLWGTTTIWEIGPGRFERRQWTAADAGLPECRPDDLKIQDAADSAAIIRRVLEGAPGPARNMVVVNAAAGLLAANRASSLADGVRQTSQAIDSGGAKRLTEYLAQFTQDAGKGK